MLTKSIYTWGVSERKNYYNVRKKGLKGESTKRTEAGSKGNIYVGKCTRPRMLFIHNSTCKICRPSPRYRDRASELVPLFLFTNIFGIFCRKMGCLGIGPTAGCRSCCPWLHDRTLRTSTAVQNYPETCKKCPGNTSASSV